MSSPQPSYASLSSIFSQSVALAPGGHVPTALAYVAAPDCFLFDDGCAIHARSGACGPLWMLQARIKLHGWVVSGTDLYVQDGPVIAQYDLKGLVSGSQPIPVNALNLDNGDHWSTQESGSPAFGDWFPGGAQHLYSAPVLWAGDSNRVFALSSKGKIFPLPADLVEADQAQFVKSFEPPANAPIRLCAPDGDPLFLQHLTPGPEGPEMVLLEQTSSGTPIQVRRKYLPAGGVEHWVGMAGAVAVPQSYSRSLRWRPDGVAQPIVYSESCGGSTPWQIFTLGNAAAVRTGGGCVLARFDSPGAVAAPPILSFRDGALLVYVLMSNGAGEARFEQYKVPSAAGQRTLPGFWPMAQSQLGAITGWLHGGATADVMPLDDDSILVCYASAARVIGFSQATYVERLPRAAARASQRMVAIAAGSGDTVGVALREVSGVPALLDGVAGFSYGVRDLALMLYKAGSPGREVVSCLLARGFLLPEVARAMHDVGFPAADILYGVWPACADPKWWAGREVLGPSVGDVTFTHFGPSEAAVSVARVIGQAGYTADALPASCRNLGTLPAAGTYAAASITLALYGIVTAEELQQRLVAAGHDPLDVRWVLRFVYNYPVDYGTRMDMANGDLPPWVGQLPFLALLSA